MRQLTTLDAQFLAVESGRAYGHVGSLATYDPSTNAANISYDKVDTSLLPPRPRTYGKKDVPARPAAAPMPAAATAAAL